MFSRQARRFSSAAGARPRPGGGKYIAGAGVVAAGAAWCFEPSNEAIRSSALYWAAADAGAALLRDYVSDAETAHSLAVAGLHHGFGPDTAASPDAAATKLLGKRLRGTGVPRRASSREGLERFSSG